MGFWRFCAVRLIFSSYLVLALMSSSTGNNAVSRSRRFVSGGRRRIAKQQRETLDVVIRRGRNALTNDGREDYCSIFLFCTKITKLKNVCLSCSNISKNKRITCRWRFSKTVFIGFVYPINKRCTLHSSYDNRYHGSITDRSFFNPLRLRRRIPAA